MATNPRIMDIMGTRPAGQGGPHAYTPHVPRAIHRGGQGARHSRYQHHRGGELPPASAAPIARHQLLLRHLAPRG